jgi:cell division protein FtsL
MTSRTFTLLFLLLSFALGAAGCATTRRQALESRGYAAGEVDEIEKQQTEYYNELFYYQQGIGKHNTVQAAATQAKVTSAYCACAKKLGDKCRQRPEGLGAADRAIWVKGNVAEGVLGAMDKKPDSAACP